MPLIDQAAARGQGDAAQQLCRTNIDPRRRKTSALRATDTRKRDATAIDHIQSAGFCFAEPGRTGLVSHRPARADGALDGVFARNSADATHGLESLQRLFDG
jgi:hypothetical protein